MPKKKHTNEDEFVFEAAESGEDELADTAAAAAKKVRDLMEKLAACRKERQEFLDGWQRQKADFLNARRRMGEERAGDALRSTASLVEKLIPLCDSFDTALREAADGDGAQWRDGVVRMHTQLLSILSSFGVTALNPAGEPFDPHRHEAVSEAPVTKSTEDQRVLEVLQKGYVLDERLIRPAKVVVGRYDG